MMRDLAKQGLDAAAFTEHNTLIHRVAARGLPERPLAVMAEEFNSAGQGHLNLFYPARELKEWIQPSNTRSIPREEYRRVIEEVHRRGGFVILNHPFALHTKWIDYHDTFGVDAIEIDSSFPALNKNTAWWHERLVAEGRRIVAVSGSDYHYNVVFPPCTACGWLNLVRLEGRPLTEANLIEALRRGHVMVSRYNNECRKTQRVLMASGEAREGDSRKAEGEADIHFRVLGYRGMWLRLYDECGAFYTKRIPSDDWTVSFRRHVGGAKAFVRADISDAFSRVLAVSNPLYFNYK
jgi:hypothetical protein